MRTNESALGGDRSWGVAASVRNMREKFSTAFVRIVGNGTSKRWIPLLAAATLQNNGPSSEQVIISTTRWHADLAGSECGWDRWLHRMADVGSSACRRLRHVTVEQESGSECTAYRQTDDFPRRVSCPTSLRNTAGPTIRAALKPSIRTGLKDFERTAVVDKQRHHAGCCDDAGRLFRVCVGSCAWVFTL